MYKYFVKGNGIIILNMKFLLCVLFIFIVVNKSKAYPFEYDIYPSILVHEEHNNVGSESRQVNIPADIYDIVNHIIEVELKDILNNGQINGDGMEIIIVPPSGQGMENPDNGGNMENVDMGNGPPMENPMLPSNSTENTPDIPVTTSTEHTITETTTTTAPETTTLPVKTTNIPTETTTNAETNNPGTTILPQTLPFEIITTETTTNAETNTAGTTILPQTLPFEIITTEANVPETTTNEITTTEMNTDAVNIPRTQSILKQELSNIKDESLQKEEINEDVENFNEEGEKRDVKAISEKQIKNVDLAMSASELRELIKLITFDSRFLRKHS
jgi:hypothetical protein